MFDSLFVWICWRQDKRSRDDLLPGHLPRDGSMLLLSCMSELDMHVWVFPSTYSYMHNLQIAPCMVQNAIDRGLLLNVVNHVAMMDYLRNTLNMLVDL